jgi:FtsP/CotA-like multicopper oxidase with cupredoxin domain
MRRDLTRRDLTRRDFLKVGGSGALLALLGSALPALASSTATSKVGAPVTAPVAAPLAAPPPVFWHLAATDGHILLPGRADPLYVFGFIDVPVGVTPNALDVYKGNVRFPAPLIGVDQDGDVYIIVTNIGLVLRPDLDDSHTLHWHGFPNATAIFDGVPEVSIAVPPGRDFPYFYHPRREGTFMYHCHFEDVEHVQMGMQGIVYVRPRQNGTSLGGFTKFAYNDGDGSTGYHREFALLLDELWTVPHENLPSIQESVWPFYKPNYWVLNGRSYPDTVLLNDDPSLPSQPMSSLIQANPGERILLRLANLGYEQHAMQMTGIRMKVVGEDATLLRGSGGADTSYQTNIIYIGPGEARDVLFTAPAFNASAAVFTDAVGSYNKYFFKNRNYQKLTNNGAPGLGGMVTELRVYNGSPLPAQATANQTYPS